jgi:hypothetical protein
MSLLEIRDLVVRYDTDAGYVEAELRSSPTSSRPRHASSAASKPEAQSVGHQSKGAERRYRMTRPRVV